MKPAAEERPTVEVTREDQDDINAYALLVQRRSEQVEALAVRLFFVLCCFFVVCLFSTQSRLVFLVSRLLVMERRRVWLCSHARCSRWCMP